MKRYCPAILVFASLFVVSALLGTGCSVNPATGKRQLSLIPESQEIAMGKQYDQEASGSMGLYDDPELTAYVNTLGKKLAATSERPALPWTFRVVDDPTVNAFALPGGYIYVTRGILAHLESEAELAGVIGHEIGHVTARHSVNQISKQQVTGLLTTGAMIARPELQQFGGLAEAGLGLMFLKFGRDDERESDGLGLRYLQLAHYDPRPMAEVMDMLQLVSASAGSGRVPGWMSTHPAPANRRQWILDQVAGTAAGGTVNRDRHLDAIDGMVFGLDPREGYFKEDRFLHPDLRFRFDLPAGWIQINQKTVVGAMAPGKDGIIQLTMAAGASPAEADRTFYEQEGISGGSVSNSRINGLPAVSRPFSITAEQGSLKGMTSFISYGGNIYRLLAYAIAEQFPGYEQAMERSVRSFDELTDRRVLDVQPKRLEVVTLSRSRSPREMVGAYNTTEPAETLALINHVAVDTRLPSGRRVKVVTGGELP